MRWPGVWRGSGRATSFGPRSPGSAVSGAWPRRPWFTHPACDGRRSPGRCRSGSPWYGDSGERSLWRWPRIAAPMIVIGLTLVHAFFWTDLRMRAPIVPAIALIAAGAGRRSDNSEHAEWKPPANRNVRLRLEETHLRLGGVGLGRLRVNPACEHDPARHREADPRRRHDPDHGRRQPVACEKVELGREIQA